MLIKTVGARIYPFYQVIDNISAGRRIFFDLTDYRGNSLLPAQIELVAQTFGLFIEPANSAVTFPNGHDLVFGKYFPRNADGVSADNSISVNIAAYQLINTQPTINARVSRGVFAAGMPIPKGVIGAQIVFDVFLTDITTNAPANVGMATRGEAVFCGASSSEIVIPIPAGNIRATGFITVEITPAQSENLNNGDFDLRLYSGDIIIAVVPIRNALRLTRSVCD